MLGGIPLGGMTLGGGSPSSGAAPVVALRTPRTADFVTTGGTGAAFEKPSPSASFEQADPSIVR